jgi:hypothetical protein
MLRPWWAEGEKSLISLVKPSFIWLSINLFGGNVKALAPLFADASIDNSRPFFHLFRPLPARPQNTRMFWKKPLFCDGRQILCTITVVSLSIGIEISMTRNCERSKSLIFLFRSIIAILIGLSATVNVTQAQVFQGGINLLVGIPQGAFKDNVNRVGVGVGVNIGLAPAGYAYMIGAEFGFMNYGTENREEPFSTTIPDVTVNVETQNNFALAHLLVRLQPNTGFLRPYLEGALGGNYLFTKTTIQNQGKSNEEVASSTNLDDFAFSYGGGAGLLISLYERGNEETTDDKQPIKGVLLELRGRYMAGSRAEYLKEGSIRREGGKVIYDVTKSQTDLLTLQLGVAVRF